MNPIEPRRPLVLKVELLNKDPNFTRTEKFRKLCLSTPCHGCGSNHPLLRSTETISENLVFEYACTTVRHSPLYPDGVENGLHIRYQLEAERLAKDCNFDEDIAISRAPSLGRESEGDKTYPPYMDSFMNDVKLMCRTHSKLPTV